MVSDEGPYFDDFEVGEEIVTDGRTVTESDVVTFAGFSGDLHPMHLDARYAQGTIFGQRIAHGLCVMGIASGNIVRKGILRQGIAFYGIEDWKFLKPLFFGDTIRVKVVVDRKIENRKADRGVVIFVIEIVNQDDAVLQSGKWKVMVYRKAAAEI